MHPNLSPQRRHPAATALSALILVAVAALATWLDTTTPSAKDASAPASEFSAERAAGRLAEFATAPRPTGSRASDETRRYLVGELREAGLRVRVQQGIGSYREDSGETIGRVQNVVATLPGQDSTGSVILAAHYDSVAAGPGAADDGSGVAAMLETVRALRADTALRNDVVLVITDGEESGLLGASSFVADDPLAERPGVVLNWEARGVSGPSLMFQTSPGNERLVELFAAGAPHPNGDSSLAALYELLPNDTDFTEFSRTLPGLNFAFLGQPGFYHTPQDSLSNLDRGSLQQHGANMLGLTREFGATDLSTLESDSDATYFRFLGMVVSYPTSAAYALCAVAVLLVVVLAVSLRNRRFASTGRMVIGFATLPVMLAVAIGLCFGLARLLTALRPELTDALYSGGSFVWAAAALAVACLAAWYALLRGRIGPAALTVACFAWLALLGAVVLFGVAPGMSFLFTVPGLLGVVGALFALGLREYAAVAPIAALTFGALAGVVLYVPLAALTFEGLGLGGGGLAATAFAVILCGLVLLPALDGVFDARPRNAALLPVGSLVLAALLAGLGLVIPQYDEQYPRRSMLGYVLRPDLDRATWVTQDADPASWGRSFAGDANQAVVPDYFTRDGPLHVGPAPTITAAAPKVRVLETRRGDDSTRVRVASARGARTLTLLVSGADSFGVRIPGYGSIQAGADASGAPAADGPRRLTVVDPPRQGIELDLGPVRQARLTVYDQTEGTAELPGFRPRPSGVDRTSNPADDSVIVGRQFQLRMR